MSDNSSQQQDTQQPARGFEALKAHVIANKVDSALWASRVLTILFAVGYVIPIFGWVLISILIWHDKVLICFISWFFSSNSQGAYYKIFMANAMTSALRLHQRMPRIAFTREYLSLLLVEDSCHYLFFSLIYLYVAPVLLIPIPIVLFAILHSASYSLTLLDVSIVQIGTETDF